MMKSDSRTEALELVINNLVLKFGNNELKNDRHQIASKLRMKNNDSFKKLCTQAEGIRRSLQFLKEDVGPRKLTLRSLENLEHAHSS